MLHRLSSLKDKHENLSKQVAEELEEVVEKVEKKKKNKK